MSASEAADWARLTAADLMATALSSGDVNSVKQVLKKKEVMELIKETGNKACNIMC